VSAEFDQAKMYGSDGYDLESRTELNAEKGNL